MAAAAGPVCHVWSADQVVLQGGVGFGGDVYRWRKQLAERGDATPAVGFVDVGVMSSTPEAQSMTQDQLASAALEVRLELGDGVVLHIVRR